MFGQRGQARIALAILQLLGTLGGAGGAGFALSQQHAADQVAAAQARVRSAHREFMRVSQRVLDEGTPPELIAPISQVEARIAAQPAHLGGPVHDRYELEALDYVSRQLAALTGATTSAEVDTEVALQSQLRQLADGYRDDLGPARAAGVDTTAYEAELAGVDAALARLEVPNAARARLQGLGNSRDTLRSATAAQVAVNAAQAAAAAALAAAKDAANYQHDRAVRDLAQAQAIRVLDVGAMAAAIAALQPRLDAAATIDDFNSVGADYRGQALALENLLAVRSDAYARLARAQRAIARAGAAGADTAAMGTQLARAAAALDVAPNIDAILAASTTVESVIVQAEAAYAYMVQHPPPPPGAVYVNGIVYHAQVYSLSCEAASLQMALSHEGINRNQDQILAVTPVDRRAPELDGWGNVVHWGDPYTSFVGDPNGFRESARYGDRSGYGTYWPTINSAASGFGAKVLRAGEGITASDIYASAASDHPSVVWVAFEWSPHPLSSYQAWDGQVVMYGAPWEHAVTVAGVANDYVLIGDPHGGLYWEAKGAFEASYAMFNQMAVTLG